MLFALAGCATLGTFQPARPIDAGTVQVGLESSNLATRTPDSGHESTTPIGVTVRYGLDDRTQIGVRAGMVAPEVLVVRRLVGDGDDDLAVSIAPSLGAWSLDTHGIPLIAVYGQTPVLFGIPVGRGSELTVGPTVAFTWAHHLELPVWGGIVNVGGSAGFALRLARGVRLLPEVAGSWPLAYAGTDLGGVGGGFTTQVGGAVLIGGERR